MAVTPTIGYRVTIWDQDGVSNAKVGTLPNAAAVLVVNLCDWDWLLTNAFVTAAMTAPPTRAKLEVTLNPGLPVHDTHASAYWGLFKGP